jgi:L-asparaginase/Glu-tRNA(Gln) amidotransferase subunit D
MKRIALISTGGTIRQQGQPPDGTADGRMKQTARSCWGSAT